MPSTVGGILPSTLLTGTLPITRGEFTDTQVLFARHPQLASRAPLRLTQFLWFETPVGLLVLFAREGFAPNRLLQVAELDLAGFSAPPSL